MKIAIVGDLHIAPIPESRIDDYFQSGLDKLSQLEDNDVVIFLGDIFTSSKIEEKYVYDLIHHLRLLKPKFYTIIGNHDVAHEDESNLNNSSLGILEAANAIEIIKPEKPIAIGDFNFNTIPVNFDKAKQFLNNKKYTQKDILLIHHLYETGVDCFTYNVFNNLVCPSIYLGHDHKPLDQGRIIYPEFTIYRSGSFMRNRADDYNFTRTIYYYVIDNGVTCKAINCLPADKVFKIEALTKQNLKKEKFIESVNEVINQYKKNVEIQKRYSLDKILKELGAPDKTVASIQKRYESKQLTYN